jgi:magnesium transporter
MADPADREEDITASPSPSEAMDQNEIYGEDGSIRQDYLAAVGAAIADRDVLFLREQVIPLHESELGDLLEAISAAQRQALVALLGDDFDFSALTEVDEAIRLEIVGRCPMPRSPKRLEISIPTMPSTSSRTLTRPISAKFSPPCHSPSGSGCAARWTIPKTPPAGACRPSLSPCRRSGRSARPSTTCATKRICPISFSQIFVIDPTFKLVGGVDLDRILRTKRQARIEDVMDETRYRIDAEMDQEEAAQLFEQYDLLSAAVVDENERLVGVLTIDDVVDVIHEEAEEDIKRLGGVGDEELSDNIISTVRSRFSWLLINLGTAILASWVISLFDATIEQMVALAVLMPIVASMGGNAGTQTMTVTVRALATRDLDIYNAGRVIRREAAVGLINGLLFAAIIGVVAGAWFASRVWAASLRRPWSSTCWPQLSPASCCRCFSTRSVPTRPLRRRCLSPP